MLVVYKYAGTCIISFISLLLGFLQIIFSVYYLQNMYITVDIHGFLHTLACGESMSPPSYARLAQ